MIRRVFQYYRNGQLSLALKIKVNQILDRWISREERRAASGRKQHRFYIRNEAEAAAFFADQVRDWKQHTPGKKKVVVFRSSAAPFIETLERALLETDLEGLMIDVTQAEKVLELEPGAVSILAIVSFCFTAKENQRIADILFRSKALREIPFEYIGDTWNDFAYARSQDRQHSFDFVSPLLLGPVDFQALYATSLERFEKKCEIRDYLDLCQTLSYLVRNDIPGDIAEFGSFKGHSGYLLSSLAEALGSNKKIYLFDTFEKFPVETIGMDAFWTDTHTVDFEEVKSKFRDRPNVQLVRGDFTTTFDTSGIRQLSFVYIDCDSYRATTYLMERLFDTVLAPGGVMILEDYGHAALLGNRLSYHHFFDSRKDCYTFFSQFSGFQIVVKR
ncbi:MAG: TylF/MycF/NovP-related O-methyltransferase [Bacteroidota bacterium]|jgi:predicted O-methyltransferase YrrM